MMIMKMMRIGLKDDCYTLRITKSGHIANLSHFLSSFHSKFSLHRCQNFCRLAIPKNISSNLASQIFLEHPGFVFPFIENRSYDLWHSYTHALTVPVCEIWIITLKECDILTYGVQPSKTKQQQWLLDPKHLLNSKCSTCLCTKRRSCPCYSARGKLDVVPSYRLLEGASCQTVCLKIAQRQIHVFPELLVWLYKILAWMTGWYCDDSWNILFYGFLLPCQLCSTFSFHNFC